MKAFVGALALAAVIAAPLFVVSTNAQTMDPARERALRECSALQARDSHDPYDRRAGVMYNYQACMAEHGQPQ